NDSGQIGEKGGKRKLTEAKRAPRDQQGRPDLKSLSPATHALDHVERDQERQERQLVAGHDAESLGGQAIGDAAQRDERRPKAAAGPGGGVGNSAKAGRQERSKPQSVPRA